MSEVTLSQPTDLVALCELHYHFQSLWPGFVREDKAGAALIGNSLIGMPFRNHVALVRSQPEQVPQLIERASTFYRALNVQPAFQLDRATTPATLAESLVEAGYSKQVEEVWMLCPLADAPATLPSTQLTVEQVTPDSPAALIQTYIDSFNLSFGVPAHVQATFGESFRGLLPNPAALHFVGFLDDEAAGALTLVHDGELGGVYNVGTFPAMRGRGVASSLLLHLLEVSHQLGLSRLLLQTRHHGPAQPIYERIGFHTHFIRDWFLPAQPGGIWS